MSVTESEKAIIVPSSTGAYPLSATTTDEYTGIIHYMYVHVIDVHIVCMHNTCTYNTSTCTLCMYAQYMYREHCTQL